MSGLAVRTVMDHTDPLYQLENTNLHARREYRIKGNLQVLAREILTRFPQALANLPRERDSAGPSDLIAEFNLASLAQVQYGSCEKGMALCEKAIRLCLQLNSESGTRRWSSELFQPWINIGRIAAAQGETDRALGIFRQVFRFVTVQEDFEVFGCRVSSVVPAPPPGQTARLSPLFEVYLQDSLKALAWAGRPSQILAFLDETEAVPGFDTPHFSRIISEARARALLDLGRYAEAAESMKKLTGWAGTDALPQPVVCVLLAEIHLQAGDSAEASNVMSGVEELYPQLCAPDVPLSERRKFRYLAGFQYFRIGDLNKAMAHLDEAVRMNQSLGDEPGVLKCGVLLLRIAGLLGRDAARRFEALHEAATRSLYRQEQAIAFYELAQAAARRSELSEAASLMATCRAILQPLGTLDSRFLHGEAERAGELLPARTKELPLVSACPEMDEMFSRLLDAGVAEPLLSGVNVTASA